MANKRYDWEAIKMEYMGSREHSVSQFMRDKLGIKVLSGGINKNTAGWATDKLKMKDDALKIAMQNATKTLGKIYTPTEEELSIGYKAVMGIFMAKAISNHQKIKKLKDGTIIIPPDVNMVENKLLWDVFKTERGEPLRINDREDYIPPSEDEDEDVIFYLPDNGRDQLELGQGK